MFALDNRVAIGGQGDRIAEVLATSPESRAQLHRIAVDGIPASGSNEDVLRRHGLDQKSLARRVLRELRSAAQPASAVSGALAVDALG